jgi:hypothetical protein
MPKQVFKLENFHGGLNSSADPRDILDSEASDITNGMLDEVGTVRTIGSVIAHSLADKTLDNTGAGVTQVPGAGLFYFSHDRKGGEDAGDAEAETGDEYLALYDDSDVQVWVYSLAADDWFDDKDSANNGVINFIGKTTGSAARPSFNSIDGSVRVSTGEFGKYDSTTDINMGSHLLITATALTVDDGGQFAVGNYIKIDDEILFVSAKPSTHVLTVTRGMFGTRDVQHQNNADIYILNMNQWYGYVNNNFFQTLAGTAEYTTNKWYNEIQHLRSLDELGISVILDDSSAASPSTSETAVNTIVVAYWTGEDGFWSGSYFLGITPIYIGGQEGALSPIGSVPIQLNEEILNMQLYICHPTIDDGTIASHPLGDDRIIGLNIYSKAFTSDEWYLLQKFDLTKGGEHGWLQYDSAADSAKGFWKTTSTADALALAAPSDTESYDGKAEDNTCTATLTLNESKGANRQGILRLTGFHITPLYKNVSLSSTSAQAIAFDVVNPSTGTHKLAVELLDENYNIMQRTEREQAITESGASPLETDTSGGYGSDAGGSS